MWRHVTLLFSSCFIQNRVKSPRVPLNNINMIKPVFDKSINNPSESDRLTQSFNLELIWCVRLIQTNHKVCFITIILVFSDVCCLIKPHDDSRWTAELSSKWHSSQHTLSWRVFTLNAHAGTPHYPTLTIRQNKWCKTPSYTLKDINMNVTWDDVPGFCSEIKECLTNKSEDKPSLVPFMILTLSSGT